jgi:hypothetical protein
MTDVLINFTEPTRSANGDLYYPRVMGRVAEDGLWEGWIEFALAGDEEIVRTGRETEQPNRTDLMYWAQGLSTIYLEGALARALRPVERAAPARTEANAESAR